MNFSIKSIQFLTFAAAISKAHGVVFDATSGGTFTCATTDSCTYSPCPNGWSGGSVNGIGAFEQFGGGDGVIWTATSTVPAENFFTLMGTCPSAPSPFKITCDESCTCTGCTVLVSTPSTAAPAASPTAAPAPGVTSSPISPTADAGVSYDPGTYTCPQTVCDNCATGNSESTCISQSNPTNWVCSSGSGSLCTVTTTSFWTKCTGDYAECTPPSASFLIATSKALSAMAVVSFYLMG
jgi:hypothetical protein